MPVKPIIIAIDGYSSTGKSSFAKAIAAEYGLLYLDSGALYRAVTLFAIENGYIHEGTLDSAALAPKLEGLDIHFKRDAYGALHTFMGERDIEKDIRTMAVADNVSSVATDATVRDYVNFLLRSFAKEGSVIMDGRDIGTTVFPDADLKLFMVADPMVRAERRAAEHRAKGEEADIAQVLENLQRRDYIDSHREISPLVKAEDAIVLDNSHMTPAEQMQWVGGLLKDKFGMEALSNQVYES